MAGGGALRGTEVYEPYKVAVEGQTEGSLTLELCRLHRTM